MRPTSEKNVTFCGMFLTQFYAKGIFVSVYSSVQVFHMLNKQKM